MLTESEARRIARAKEKRENLRLRWAKAEDDLTTLIYTLRARGATWTAIADALGVSRQAVHHKYVQHPDRKRRVASSHAQVVRKAVSHG